MQTQGTSSSGAIQSTTASSTSDSDSTAIQTSSSNCTRTRSLPDGTRPTTYTEPYMIKAVDIFDGKMLMFECSHNTCSKGRMKRQDDVHYDDHDGTIENVLRINAAWRPVCPR